MSFKSPYRTFPWLRTGTESALGNIPFRHFFIDATLGNDANTGRSPEEPWQTIGKINGEMFLPGDNIRLRRGRTWTGTGINALSSGMLGQRIFYSSYGSGANPIIDMAQEYNDFVADVGFIWKRTLGYEINQCFEDNARLIKAVNYGAMVQGSYFWDSGAITLYVWCTDDGNPNTGHAIEHAAAWDRGFDFNGKSNIVVDSIDVRRAAPSGFSLRVVAGSTNITMKNCHSSWNGSRGFDLGGYVDMSLNNIEINDCKAYQTVGEGFFLANGGNLRLIDCECYDVLKDGYNKGYATAGKGGGILVGIRAVDALVRNCHVHDIHYLVPLYVEYEATYDRPLNTVVEKSLIEGMASVNSEYAIYLEGQNTIFKNNIVRFSFGQGAKIGDGSTNEKVYHNSFYTTGDNKYAIAMTTALSGLQIKNNIFRKNGAGKAYFIGVWAAAQAGVTFDNNDYSALDPQWYWQGGGDETPNNLADWRTESGGDANAIDTNPAFVNEGAGDFHLQVGSPCRGAGAIDTDVTDDYDGVARPDPPTQPDIGAYQFVP